MSTTSGQPPITPGGPTSSTDAAAAAAPSAGQSPLIRAPSSSRPPSASVPRTLAEKLRKSVNRSLKRLAPIKFSEFGRPTTHIPDTVFQRGAEFHKDFIICYFNGRPPLYNQIQSVLNHMWGKGCRLEIHVNHLSGTMLVRIPNDFIREKVLEKGIWYIGDSMFHTAPWASHSASDSPAFDFIPIWIHMFNIPLDLRTKEGISLVSGLVGEPKETDDFTVNLVSLKVSHAKVLLDLTKPLPDVVDFTRDNGQVVEVKVYYPWLPPTCSHCKELGHIVKNCLQLPPPVGPPPKSSVPKTKKSKGSAATTNKGKDNSEIPTSSAVSTAKDPLGNDTALVAHPPPSLKTPILSPATSALTPTSNTFACLSSHPSVTPALTPIIPLIPVSTTSASPPPPIY